MVNSFCREECLFSTISPRWFNLFQSLRKTECTGLLYGKSIQIDGMNVTFSKTFLFYFCFFLTYVCVRFFLPFLLLVFLLCYISLIAIRMVLAPTDSWSVGFFSFSFFFFFLFSKRFTSFWWFVLDEFWRFISSCSADLQQICHRPVFIVVCSQLLSLMLLYFPTSCSFAHLILSNSVQWEVFAVPFILTGWFENVGWAIESLRNGREKKRRVEIL